MKLLTLGSVSFVTSDEIGDAVVRLSVALSNCQQVDAVEIPFIDDEGRSRRALVTIGGLTAPTSADHLLSGTGPRDPELLREIERRTAALHPRGDVPLTAEELPQGWTLDEAW